MDWREKFILPPTPYFLSHSVGLMPKGAAAALEQGFAAPWRDGRADAWDVWLATIDRFRRAISAVIGADAGDVCPQTNISSALAKIIHSLPREKHRNKIVLTRADFPTIGYVARAAERTGLEIAFIDGGPALAEPDAWARAFRDDVFLVHATHVFSNLGLRTPVAEITRRARAAGAFSVVDCAQSAGAVAIDVDDWAADFVTGTSVKYLCGGPGAAWVWARRETANLAQPIDAGWFSAAEPFSGDIERFDFAEGATRYWGGTPSVAPYAFAAAGAETIAGIGVDAIEAHAQRLVSRLLDGLKIARPLSHTKAGERGSSLVVSSPDMTAAAQALAKIGAAHDRRMGGFRLSVHAYTREEDIDALIAALG